MWAYGAASTYLEPSVSNDVGIETQMLTLLHLPQAAVSSVHTHTHNQSTSLATSIHSPDQEH